MAKHIMFQGTGSDVGKSLIVAGLCRAFANRGVRVCPFKPQNMSNNAAVTEEGGEIGRAQWLQAKAARIEPSVDMNPVLLKPQSDKTAQVIVQGKLVEASEAADYISSRGALIRPVMESYHRLSQHYDLILVEGAGSASEVNLRQGDIANMGFAKAANCPTVLIGDIDRGGVIASLVGTHTVLPPEDREHIVAYLINKFRGDERLFDGGIHAIGEHTGWHHAGTLPYFPELWQLPQEDGLAPEYFTHYNENASLHVVVPVTPKLSNFDDIDPLRGEPDVRLTFLRAGEALPGDTDLVILAGSKSVIDDLAFLRAQRWDIDILAHVNRGGHVLGICGGYQMLGNELHDPHLVEGKAQHTQGLGLLDISTIYYTTKHVRRWQGCLSADNAVTVDGYEIHMGTVRGADTRRTFLHSVDGIAEGAVSKDGRIIGTSVHGILTSDTLRRQLLGRLGGEVQQSYNYYRHVDAILDAWAEIIEAHLDLDALLALSTDIMAKETASA